MKWYLVCLFCGWQIAVLSASAQESPRPSPSKTTPASAPAGTPSATKVQSRPEMRKLLDFSGRWFYRFEYPAGEGASSGKTTEGKAVFRSGPGGLSLIQDDVETDAGKTTVSHWVTWWDEKAHGYRAIWCDTDDSNGCTVLSQLGKWEGDQLVLGDEFTKDGKKYVSKEVWSEITPDSFTRTLSRGEAGKELKRVVTIHATKAGKGGSTNTPPTASVTPSPKPK